MKGVILAGGTGTRLSPITKVINKHLLPVGPYPMIFWPISSLRDAGIEEILIITGKQHLSSFIQLLGRGDELGVSVSYQIQESADGIADAILYAEKFVKNEKFVVLLGDNLFEDSLTPYIDSFKNQKKGARVLLKEVNEPERYGIASLASSENKIVSIVEKPKYASSSYCVTGAYMYNSEVFSLIKELAPSERGELEVTDLNNLYINKSELLYDILPGWWIDAGTHQSLYKANTFIYNSGKVNN